jgi:hypothetical protein
MRMRESIPGRATVDPHDSLVAIGSALLQVSVDPTEPERRERCDRCGSTDASGGVMLRDDTGAVEASCRDCTRELLAAVLMPQFVVALAS